MNNLRTNISGLDAVLDTFQKDLYDSLASNLNFEVYGFPRVYKNNTDKGVVPEIWNEAKNDYDEVFLDNNQDLSFFFIDGDVHTTDNGNFFKAPLKIVFIANLEKFDTISRADSELHRLAVHSIQEDTYQDFIIDGIEKGVENVFRGFKTDQIQADDLQPWHIFAVTGKIGYYLNQRCQ